MDASEAAKGLDRVWDLYLGVQLGAGHGSGRASGYRCPGVCIYDWPEQRASLDLQEAWSRTIRSDT